jgi:DNA-binding transcriptional LysR family regulator
MRGTEFAEMEAFVAIAERASFARAAAHLGVSRPTLSQSLRALEERLGVRLLHRTTRSVALTEAGQRLLERARPALAELAAATQEVHELGDEPTGLLRIVALPPVAHLVVAPLMARFLARHPRIRLDLSVSKTPADIVRDGFDAGMRLGEQIERDMIFTRVTGEVCFGALASPAYLARHGAPATPRDLRSHACIRARLQNGAMFGWEFAKKGKMVQVTVDGPLITDDIDMTVRGMLDGVGIGYGLIDWVRPHIDAGRLVHIMQDWSPRLSGYFLYHSSARRVTPPLRAFIDFLKAEIPRLEKSSGLRSTARRATRPRHRLVP